MERCDDIRRWLDAFVDGELGQHDRRKVEAHVASCPRCRAEVERTRELNAALRTDAAAEEPGNAYFDALPGRIEARFDFDEAERKWLRPAADSPRGPRRRPSLGARTWFRLALGTATVAVVAVTIRLVQHPPLRPESVEVRTNELSRTYRAWQEETKGSDHAVAPSTVGQLPPPAETSPSEAPDFAEERGPSFQGARSQEELAEPLRPEDRSATAPAAVPATSPAEAPAIPQPELTVVPDEPDEPVAMSLSVTPPPADTLAVWGRDLALLLTEAVAAPRPRDADRLARDGFESKASRQTRDVTVGEAREAAEHAPGPADLLIRETDATLSDSLWVRGWRYEARRLADLAVLTPAPERCRIALAAYHRVGLRGGRDLFPNRAARAAAFTGEKERIEALLRCLGP